MLFRFSLYGFLKNQRYFEPFLMLFFIENHLRFGEIGLLIGIRELLLNLFEIPSGSIADNWGRKRSMIFSFVMYIISFLLFSFAYDFYLFLPAIAFFALGDAFRTGTHKAMIFTWLRTRGMISQKTRYYGITRSWSKYGSAFSLLIAGAVLFVFHSYRLLFVFSIFPYLLGIINFLRYPDYIDPVKDNSRHGTNVFLKTLWTSFKKVIRIKNLLRLLFESIFFEGGFKASKDYLQPILQNMAIGVTAFYWLQYSEKENEALIISLVYMALYLLSAISSRMANFLVEISGNEENASHTLWKSNLVLYSALLPILLFKWYIGAIFIFIVINMLQNFWRPILISRFEQFTSETDGATILSIESQAKSMGTVFFAPIIGFMVDFSQKYFNQLGEFWPVALTGVILALPFMVRGNIGIKSKES